MRPDEGFSRRARASIVPARMPPSTTRIVPFDAATAFAFAPRVAVAVWRGDVTMPRVMGFGREIRTFLPSCQGRGYASITVIEPGISLRIPEDVRSASEALQREFAPHIKCMVYLVQQTGFVAAAARTIASGFTLITRAPYPLKVLSTSDETASWCSTYADVDAAEISRIVREARAA
jgi:hypothetical protein